MIIKTFAPRRERAKFPLTSNQYVLLMPIGDIHYQTRGWPEEKFKEHIKWGLDRGAYFLGMGEFLDSMSESQRAIVDTLRQEQQETIDDMMREAADNLIYLLRDTAGRWVGAIEGDHRWDFTGASKDDPQSLDQYICRALGADFLGTEGWVRISPGIKGHPEADCLLLAHHGVGNSQTAGGHLNRVEKQVSGFEADIYLMGHSHSKSAAATDRQYLSPANHHYHRTKVLARTGGWLLGYNSSEPLSLNESASRSRGSYVERKALQPSALGGLCIGIGYEEVEDGFYRPTLHYSV
jgi:hypothetical protein